MAHPQQREFISLVKNKFPQHFTKKFVVELGSLNINGTVREFFPKCVYAGVDISSGPCVDYICLGHEFDMPDNSFDVAVSCECFEHDPHWKLTFANMIRLCKPGGLVLFTCATTGRKPHGLPDAEPQSSPLTVEAGWNYYCNLTEQDFRQNFDFDAVFETYEFSQNTQSFDLYFYGFKR